jgi:WD40 repeat protein
VYAAVVTLDGARIVSSSQDHTTRVWDLASGRLERTIEGHAGAVYAAAVTPDGARIVSSSQDQTVRVWDLASGQEIASWSPDHRIKVLTCCTVPTEGSVFVYGDSVGGVHLLQLLEGQTWESKPFGAPVAQRAPTND